MASVAETNGTEEVVVKKQRKTYPKDSFDRFGDDLCGLILPYLSLDERLDYECVSKQFRRTVFKSVVAISIHDTESTESRIKVSNIGLLATIHGKCPHIHTIDLRGIQSECVAQTAEVLDLFGPNLRHIYCNYDRNVYEKLPEIGSLVTRIDDISEEDNQRLRRCRRLSRLRVQWLSDIFSDTLDHLLVKNLVTFEVPFNSDEDNQHLSAFVTQNQSLRSYKEMNTEMQFVYNGSHDTIVEMAAHLSRLPQLRELSLNLLLFEGQNTLNECLRPIGQKCPQLQCLTLKVRSIQVPLNGHTLDSLKSFRRLKRFDLSIVYNFEWTMDDTFLDPLKKCRRLTHLSLRSLYSSDPLLNIFGDHWPRLHYLFIQTLTLPRNGLDGIARLPALQTLVFECFYFIGERVLLTPEGKRLLNNVCEDTISRSAKLKTIEIRLLSFCSLFYFRDSSLNV